MKQDNLKPHNYIPHQFLSRQYIHEHELETISDLRNDNKNREVALKLLPDAGKFVFYGILVLINIGLVGSDLQLDPFTLTETGVIGIIATAYFRKSIIKYGLKFIENLSQNTINLLEQKTYICLKSLGHGDIFNQLILILERNTAQIDSCKDGNLLVTDLSIYCRELRNVRNKIVEYFLRKKLRITQVYSLIDLIDSAKISIADFEALQNPSKP